MGSSSRRQFIDCSFAGRVFVFASAIVALLCFAWLKFFNPTNEIRKLESIISETGSLVFDALIDMNALDAATLSALSALNEQNDTDSKKEIAALKLEIAYSQGTVFVGTKNAHLWEKYSQAYEELDRFKRKNSGLFKMFWDYIMVLVRIIVGILIIPATVIGFPGSIAVLLALVTEAAYWIWTIFIKALRS
jgi:hypothetical protein